jgi:trk system potassium uptake protein TrkA
VMHVVVVGCGRVGAGLATELDKEGHSVVVIDKLQRAFRRLPAEWGGKTVVGFGFDKEHLDEAGAAHADALAAVTSGDNSNILTARIARETYDIPNVVARIYDPRRAEIFQRLGIPTVPSVTWTIDQVFRRILPGEGSFEWTDGSGQLHLVERPLPADWAGRKITSMLPEGVRLVSVIRATAPSLQVDGLVGQDGDVLYLAVTDTTARRLSEMFGDAPAPEETRTRSGRLR